MQTYKEVMASLKTRIENSGLTMQQVAECMNISVRTLKSYLSGKTLLRVRHIYGLCFILKISPNALLGFENE